MELENGNKTGKLRERLSGIEGCRTQTDYQNFSFVGGLF